MLHTQNVSKQLTISFALYPKCLNNVFLYTQNMFEQKTCCAPKMFEQKYCFAPIIIMVEQKPCFAHKMFEQKSCFTSKLFEQKSCFAPKKVANKLNNKCFALHSKYFSKSVALLPPQMLDKTVASHKNGWTKRLLCTQNFWTKVLLHIQNIWTKVLLCS